MWIWLSALGLSALLWCGTASAQTAQQIMDVVERRCRAVPLDELEALFQRVRVGERLESGPADNSIAVCNLEFGDPAAPATEGNLRVMVSIRAWPGNLAEAQAAFTRLRLRDKGDDYNGLGDEAYYSLCDLGSVPLVCGTVRKGGTVVAVTSSAFERVPGGKLEDFRGRKVDNRLLRQTLALAAKYAERVRQ